MNPATDSKAIVLAPALTPAKNHEDPLDLMRFAVEHGAGVETIERMMAVRREVRAEQAKEAYDAAMSQFQSECPTIVKRKKGYDFKYSPIEDILETPVNDDETVKQLIKRHGFSYSSTSEAECPPGKPMDGWVTVFTTIKHIHGHSEVFKVKMPVDNNTKTSANTPQRYGGAITYGERYAFRMGFGIKVADEDMDGRLGRPKPKGPKQATEATRRWMIDGLQDIRQAAIQYGIDQTLLMPDQGLEHWPLEKVPTTKDELAALRKRIEAHK